MNLRLALFGSLLTIASALAQTYVVNDTGQNTCYDLGGRPVSIEPGSALDGQDAQVITRPMHFKRNGDGTVSDLNTGLMWQQITPATLFDWQGAAVYAKQLRLGGHDDWRLPTIKELTSIADFKGSIRTLTPYIDLLAFDFTYPEPGPGRGHRIIDGQYWSSTPCLDKTMFGDTSAYGFNFADGHIKAYPVRIGNSQEGAQMRIRCVRGNPTYGHNQFVDNHNGTVTDTATGLTWQKASSAQPMMWQEALTYARNLDLGGHTDWRLPDVKELLSIVDYSRTPAIDPIFTLAVSDAWGWTSTSQGNHPADAVYVCFGRAMSMLRDRSGNQVDAHGAGAMRSDPKLGSAADWPQGRGPQSDEVRIRNYVFCVRGGLAN